MINENIKFGKIEFRRNGVLASGILGVTGWGMSQAAKSGAGGITTKSISKNVRAGHSTPVIQAFESGLINAVGLSSTGVENSNNEIKILRDNSDAVIIASVFGATPEEFRDTVSELSQDHIDAIELNFSCPNVADEFGCPFAASSKVSSSITKLVRSATNLPLIIKLSPNFPGIGDIAKACEDAGADGITAINTVGPGLLIDINTFSPKLSNKVGGVSGPAILPIALRSVYDIYKSVKIPIIGTGGIVSVEDALQMIMAGAAVYGVGTGILYEGLEIFSKINKGIEIFMKEKNMTYKELVGIAHKI